MDTILLETTEVPYEIKKNTRAKRLTLRITHEGVLSITLPRFTSQRQALEFVHQKSSWILSHIEKARKHQSIKKEKLASGSTIKLFGKDHYILEIKESKGKRVTFKASESDIPLTLPTFTINIPKSHPNPNKAINTALDSFYRQQARDYLTARTDHYCHQMGLTYNQIRLKDTKTRWGSCSKQKNLNYNYRILLAPQPVIDYLVIHEVAHLKHLNHSKNFWSLVESHMPDYKVHMKWLRENGAILQLF